jgi:hypothetical protein
MAFGTFGGKRVGGAVQNWKSKNISTKEEEKRLIFNFYLVIKYFITAKMRKSVEKSGRR